MSSPESIAEIRKRFEEEVAKNPDKYHPIDIERVKTEEWQVKRFLDDKPSVDEAFEALCKAMQWKKEFGIHDRKDQDFPKEFWVFCGVEVNGEDKEGRIIQWETLSGQKFFKELNLITKQFVAHNLERVDRMAGEKGFINLINSGGAGVSNLDTDVSKFKLSIIEHYPSGIRQLLYVDLPWLLSPVLNTILAMLSPRLKAIVAYAKSKELPNYMDKELIPKSLGGSRTEIKSPEDLVPLSKMMDKLQLTDKFVDSYYSTYKQKRP